MKNILILLTTLIVISCSSDSTTDTSDAWDGVGRIGDYDGGASVLNADEGSNEISNENDQYACAKVYLQIPYETTNDDTGERIVVLSHQLWSVPVRRSVLMTDDPTWYAVPTDYNIDVPTTNNTDFENDEGAYAILILEDGSILYDQIVLPISSRGLEYSWQVCETLYCGQAGCQEHEEFEHQRWSCHPTQSRAQLNDIPDKCPCKFNDTGYAYCDLQHAETEE